MEISSSSSSILQRFSRARQVRVVASDTSNPTKGDANEGDVQTSRNKIPSAETCFCHFLRIPTNSARETSSNHEERKRDCGVHETDEEFERLRSANVTGDSTRVIITQNAIIRHVAVRTSWRPQNLARPTRFEFHLTDRVDLHGLVIRGRLISVAQRGQDSGIHHRAGVKQDQIQNEEHDGDGLAPPLGVVHGRGAEDDDGPDDERHHDAVRAPGVSRIHGAGRAAWQFARSVDVLDEGRVGELGSADVPRDDGFFAFVDGRESFLRQVKVGILAARSGVAAGLVEDLIDHGRRGLIINIIIIGIIITNHNDSSILISRK